MAPGAAIALTLAVGRAGRLVPTIVGLTVDRAVAKLRAAGLQLGQVTAHGSAGTPIARQVPLAGHAGATRQRGCRVAHPTADDHDLDVHDVDVDVDRHRPRPPPVPTLVAVPEVTGLKLGDAINALGSAGLRPHELPQISSEVPAGSLIGQEPKARVKLKPGSTVTLLVSAGMPDIAYDKDGHVFVAGGLTGSPVHAAARGSQQDEQPAWNPTGTLIAFRRGDADHGRIWVATAGKPATAHPLTASGFDDRRPAFSPNGKVIAFVRGASRTAEHDLCLVRLANPKDASCVHDAKLDVSRPAWSPERQPHRARRRACGPDHDGAAHRARAPAEQASVVSERVDLALARARHEGPARQARDRCRLVGGVPARRQAPRRQRELGLRLLPPVPAARARHQDRQAGLAPAHRVVRARLAARRAGARDRPARRDLLAVRDDRAGRGRTSGPALRADEARRIEPGLGPGHAGRVAQTMLCRSCHRQLSRRASVCDRCGAPVRGASPPLELVLPDQRRIVLAGHLDAGRGDVERDPARRSERLATACDVRRRRGRPRRSRTSGRATGRGCTDAASRAPCRSSTACGSASATASCASSASAHGERGRAHAGRAHRRDGARARGRGDIAWASPAPALGLRAQATRGGRGRRALRARGQAGRRLRATRRGRGRAARAPRRPPQPVGAGLRGRAAARPRRARTARAPARRPGRARHALRRRRRDRRARRSRGAGDAPSRRDGSSSRWAPAMFDRLYARGGWILFTRVAFVLEALLGIAGLAAFVYLVTGRYGTPFVVAKHVGLGGAVFVAGRFLAVALHELAHGLTMSSFGRRVRSAGFKVVGVFPYAYVDTSEAWFEPRRRRIAISRSRADQRCARRRHGVADRPARSVRGRCATCCSRSRSGPTSPGS